MPNDEIEEPGPWSVPQGSRAVVAFAGHMTDAPGRAVPRFTRESESVVAASIHEQLSRCHACAGITSLASGADMLFAKAIMELGAELHLVLPVNVEAFLESSVRPSGDDRWETLFHEIRARATSEEVIGDDYLSGSGTPFQLAALFIDGKAQMLAAESGESSRTLCVWDGLPGDGLGGTASFVGHSARMNRVVRAVHPRTGELFVPGPDMIASAQRHSWSTRRAGSTVLEHRLLSCLFADAKGFGGLRETQIPAFARTVLGIIENAIRESAVKPMVLNTWGDGLFIATEHPRDCAEIALRLLEGARKVRFEAEGLPGKITFRIGMHTGPAFFTPLDPLIKQPNAYGRDVSRAARIEPIATAGEAWASRSFVVLAHALGTAGLAFDDLGEHPLPKDSGTLHVYRVRRK